MNREYILSILYDLTLTIGGETRLDSLLSKVLQRLLYHTSFPVGLVFTELSRTPDEAAGMLSTVIGDHQLEHDTGTRLVLPAPLDMQQIELLQPPELPSPLFGSDRHHCCLRLPVDQSTLILLLSPGPAGNQLPLTQIFQPVLANLSKAILLCRNNEALTRALASDRDQARAQLASALERFELAMRAANDGVWDWDLESDNVYYSPRWKSMLGYQEDELPDTLDTWKQTVDPRDRDKTLRLVEDCLAGRSEGFVTEFRMRHRDGHSVYVLSRGILVRDAQGKAVRMVGTHVDLSERKAAERAILDKEKAEASAKAKSQFLANMSHEIRTPLAGVMGLADMGRQQDSLERAHELFRKIGITGQSLLRVVDDILDFSKIEAGKLTIENRPFDLHTTVTHVTDITHNLARNKGLALVVRIADEVEHWVSGDSLRLEQVLSNLLSNAIKFTDSGEVALKVGKAGQNVEFRISDTGIGMTAEQMDRLYHPFEQADSTTTRRFGGTGLGLAISFNLARLMDGAIRATSQPGIGTEFTVSVPLPPAEPQQLDETPDATENEQRLQGLRILVAEDVEINQMIVEDLLTGEGAEASFAFNGRQAVERVANAPGRFDLVLMDIQMPEMDGYEATRRIHAIRPELPVVGLTAHALPEERDRCMEAGMLDHVTKPIDAEKLLAAIREHALQSH